MADEAQWRYEGVGLLMAGDVAVIRTDGLEMLGRRCGEIIRAGGVLVYPTDTFYALGADPRNREAVRSLFAVKGRQTDQPILLLLSDAEDVYRWTAEVTGQAQKLMKRFWPGPLTLVFKAREDVLPELTAGTGKIGLRVPGNPLTRSLLHAVGTALTGTSANRSGEAPPVNVDAARRSVGDRVHMLIDGGNATVTLPSTVVDVSREKPVLLRRGAIDESEIEWVLTAQEDLRKTGKQG